MLAEIQDFNKWLRRKNPQATTPIHYTNDLLLFFQWANKSPAQITVREIDQYIEHCQSLGHAVATINRRLAALRSFYNFLDLIGEERVSNPVRPKRHFIRQGRRLPRDVEDEVLEQFFRVIRSVRDRAMFLLMLRCGLRIEEVHNLSLGDLYLHASPTSLPRLWLHGKGSIERVVYLSAQAQTALEAWLEVRPLSSDPAVFLNRFGRRLSISGIQKRLAAYRREAGLHLSSHQLRHTFGRHLVEARVPATTIQRLLGHARLRTSELYMHLSDQQVQADYQAAMSQVARRLSLGGGHDET
jgi:site-specific recombinase XerC